VNITDAQPGASADLKSREKRYGITMAIRVACFLIAVIWVPSPYLWVLLAAAAVLPYVAVIIANQADQRRRRPRLRTRNAGRPELTGAKASIGSAQASSNGQSTGSATNGQHPPHAEPDGRDRGGDPGHDPQRHSDGEQRA
jgi:hypothetical protein